MKKRKIKWLPETAFTEDIDDTTYFEGHWKGYVSNSRLGLVDPSTGGSIKLFEKSFEKKKKSAALNLGTIVHSLLLQADDFLISDYVKPSGKVGDIVYDVYKMRQRNSNMKAYEALEVAVKYHDYYNGKPSKRILENLIRDGKPYYLYLKKCKEKDFILNSDEVNVALGCMDSLTANATAYSLLFPTDPKIQSFNEMAIACDAMLDTTRYTLKIKIDNWTLDLKNKRVVLNDLKTTGVGLQNFVDGYWEFYPTATEDIKIFHPGSFQKYKYYRQLAMYAKVLSLYVEKEYGFKPIMDVNIVAVETKEPFWSETFNFGTFIDNKFSMRQLTVGLQEMENLLWILSDNNYEPITVERDTPYTQAFI